MKTCPICETAYPNDRATCITDGAMLVASAEMDPGTVIRGKYRIIRTLGRGGMGTVYLAEHLLLGRLRALKFLYGQLSHDVRFFNRFRKEAQAAVELRHPNIVEVVDLDQAEDGTPYMAMEFVDGPDLRHLLKHGPLDVHRALAIARGVARGLGVAHHHGIVHRDLKPENILIAAAYTPQETAKLADFGIAAMNDAATAVYQTQSLMLTPEYASPEQWRGMSSRELDGRADLYALGCVMFEMLTGTQPFSAANPQGWMYQHLQSEPRPLSAVRPEFARWPGLDAFVLSLLAKEREQRMPTADAVVAHIDTLMSGSPAGPGTPISTPTPVRMPTPPPSHSGPQRVATPPASLYAGAVPRSSTPVATPPPGPPAAARAETGPRLVSGTAHAVQSAAPVEEGAVAEPADPEEPRSSRRVLPLVLAGALALLLLSVLLAFGLPVSTVESIAASFDRPDHSGPALLLHQLACSRGNGAACSELGSAYFNGPGGASDPGTAAIYYSRACDNGDAAGCLASGSDYELGQGVSQSLSRAADYYSRGCSMGNAKSCTNLARVRNR